MYSVVLMAALATSSSAPEFGHRGCHGGGYGCSGGYATWCSGYGSGWGCYGWGCYGAGGHGCYGGWSGGGSCYGSGCYGYQTGWSCSGSWGGGSPYTVSSCFGAGGAGFRYGGYGCGGGPGAYGGYSGYGVPIPGGITYTGPGMTNPTAPGTVAPNTAAPEITPAPKAKGSEQSRAKVRIELPADARLFVDGILMKTGSAIRVFQTPELNPDQSYVYDVKAELVRNNQSFSETQQLVVRPGEQATASFMGLEQKAAAAQTSQSTAQR